LSDCGILFSRDENLDDGLFKMLKVIKKLNSKMLDIGFMLTTSIAYGKFDYSGKIELKG
jgi:hypothetical protein